MMKAVDTHSFESPLRLDYSNGAMVPLADNVESVMELFIDPSNPRHASVEWVIATLDRVEHIGLTFDIDGAGKRKLVDYDGVFELPYQMKPLFDRNDIDYSEVLSGFSDYRD